MAVCDLNIACFHAVATLLGYFVVLVKFWHCCVVDSEALRALFIRISLAWSKTLVFDTGKRLWQTKI
jgi:hypothetical protein